MKLSIIIPIYNERKTVEKVLTLLEQVSFPEEVKKEYIVIDDGSVDGTQDLLKNILKDKDTSIWKSVFHTKNKGKGAAIRSGIQKATGDYILIQDADLEYHPKYIPSLLHHLLQNKAQVIYGTRLKRLPNFSKEESNPLFVMHYLGNRFLSFLVSVLYNTWLTDIETGYKLLPAKYVKEMTLSSHGFDIEAEITVKLLKKGYTIKEVPIVTKPRGYKEGKKLHAIPEGIKAVKIIVIHKFI